MTPRALIIQRLREALDYVESGGPLEPGGPVCACAYHPDGEEHSLDEDLAADMTRGWLKHAVKVGGADAAYEPTEVDYLGDLCWMVEVVIEKAVCVRRVRNKRGVKHHFAMGHPEADLPPIEEAPARR